ncbi:ABC transporter permease [Paenibacillus protaetiae]|uniref:ABC transporter permease n=1 Tax=Paenibacillus protaetiae TaxID=2509456 RepID=A0A4V0YEX5_9BACL|nr:ABC transporter permease [Paenibacillus protaetiae]QAY65731.1 ABC transporter permease [Paenibacillus protaetiae]
MRAYYAVCKLRLLNGLQYRAAALAGLATQFFWGFMYIMIYQAFYSNAVHSQPMSLQELVAYLWLQQSFLAFVMLWFRDPELFQLITTGNIAYELCRPTGLYGFWYAKLLAQRIASALLRCFPIMLAAMCLPKPYRLPLPPDFASLMLFIIALLLGLLVVVAVSMFIYISVFITMSPTGSILLIGVFGEFFAGVIVPVPLMPEWLQHIVYALPFRWTADFPFRVYSGNIGVHEAAVGIGVQLGWLVLLTVLGKLALDKALQKVVVQGG